MGVCFPMDMLASEEGFKHVGILARFSVSQSENMRNNEQVYKGDIMGDAFDSCGQGRTNGNPICTAHVQVHPAWQMNGLNCTFVLR